MKTLKSILAVILSSALTAQSIPAAPIASPADFKIKLPSSLGYISETYAPAFAKATTAKLDFILIQDLHVNRSVQFAISEILQRLKRQGFMPDRIAVEGDTGPVDLDAMQRYPDSDIRKKAADYLVQQGEMPGAMHFAVTDGRTGLFGIETDSYYQANLEMFRRSYSGRAALRQEIEKLEAVLPRLFKDKAIREKASILEGDVQAIRQLINNEVIPEELPDLIARASTASEHVKQVLGQKGDELVEPLSASINFYALALLRDQEFFNNALAVRQLGRQKTSIVVTGGFHTEAFAQQLKQKGFSYAVITPNVKRHDKTDEKLYVARLLDQHLSTGQVATGADWAAQLVQPLYRGVSTLFLSAALYWSTLKKRSWGDRAILFGRGAAALALCGSLACGSSEPTMSAVVLRGYAPTEPGTLITPEPSEAPAAPRGPEAPDTPRRSLGSKIAQNLNPFATVSAADQKAAKPKAGRTRRPTQAQPKRSTKKPEATVSRTLPSARIPQTMRSFPGSVPATWDDESSEKTEPAYTPKPKSIIYDLPPLQATPLRTAFRLSPSGSTPAPQGVITLESGALVGATAIRVDLSQAVRNPSADVSLTLRTPLGVKSNPVTVTLVEGVANIEIAQFLEYAMRPVPGVGDVRSDRLNGMSEFPTVTEIVLELPADVQKNKPVTVQTLRPARSTTTPRPTSSASPSLLDRALNFFRPTLRAQEQQPATVVREEIQEESVSLKPEASIAPGFRTFTVTVGSSKNISSLRLTMTDGVKTLWFQASRDNEGVIRSAGPLANSLPKIKVDEAGRYQFTFSWINGLDLSRAISVSVDNVQQTVRRNNRTSRLAVPFEADLRVQRAVKIETPLEADAVEEVSAPVGLNVLDEQGSISPGANNVLSGLFISALLIPTIGPLWTGALALSVFGVTTILLGSIIGATWASKVWENRIKQMPQQRILAAIAAILIGALAIIGLSGYKNLSSQQPKAIPYEQAPRNVQTSEAYQIRPAGQRVPYLPPRINTLSGDLFTEHSNLISRTTFDRDFMEVGQPTHITTVIEPQNPANFNHFTLRILRLNDSNLLTVNYTRDSSGLWVDELVGTNNRENILKQLQFGIRTDGKIFISFNARTLESRGFKQEVISSVSTPFTTITVSENRTVNRDRAAITGKEPRLQQVAMQQNPSLPPYLAIEPGIMFPRRSQLVSATMLDTNFMEAGEPRYITVIIRPENPAQFDSFFVSIAPRLDQNANLFFAQFTRQAGLWSSPKLLADRKGEDIRRNLQVNVNDRDGSIHLRFLARTLERRGIRLEVISGQETAFTTTTIAEDPTANRRQGSVVSSQPLLKAGLMPMVDDVRSAALFLMATILGFFSRQRERNATYKSVKATLAGLDFRTPAREWAALFTTPYQVISDRLTQQALQDRLRRMREAAARARQLAIAA